MIHNIHGFPTLLTGEIASNHDWTTTVLNCRNCRFWVEFSTWCSPYRNLIIRAEEVKFWLVESYNILFKKKTRFLWTTCRKNPTSRTRLQIVSTCNNIPSSFLILVVTVEADFRRVNLSLRWIKQPVVAVVCLFLVVQDFVF